MKKLYCLLAVLTLLLCSCLPNEFFSSNSQTTVTTQAQTDPASEATSSDTQEPTTSEPETTQPTDPPHEHTFEVGAISKEPTCIQAGAYTVICSCGIEETRTIPASGKHNYVTNECVWCHEQELTLVSATSKYDADGDGQKDVYDFSSEPAQRCENAIWLWAGNYDKGLSIDVNSATANEIQHWYVEAGTNQRLTYHVNVPEAGVYEMIVHLRLKDDYVRGAKYTFNAGTQVEQMFETSHTFSTNALTQARNAETMGSYMYGIRVYLQGGANVFSITAANDSRTQHFREFYFVKVEESHSHDFALSEVTKQPTCHEAGAQTLVCGCGQAQELPIPATGEHSFVNHVCSVCAQKEIPLYGVSSNYDADGDRAKDIYYFSPEQSDLSKQGIHVWAGNYDKELTVDFSAATINGIKHWYVEANSSQSLTYRVTVPEEGIYEMILYMRLKDGEERGARYVINGGTAYEHIIETSHAFDATTLEQARDTNVGTYMYGIYVKLVAGENVIQITSASSTSKTQHYRDFYFVKIGDLHQHTYLLRSVISQATCVQDGEAIFYCTCGNERAVLLPATTKHIYADGNCLICKCEKQESGIEYEFLSPKSGFAGGTVLLVPKLSGIYTLYWGNENGKLPSYTQLGSFTAYAGKVTEYSLHANTAIPQGATCLLAIDSGGGKFVYTFVIPKERLFDSEKLYSFGALADTHQGTRYGDESLSLQRLINAGVILSQKGSVLIGINGDIANENVEREYVLHSEAIQSIFAVNPSLPVYSVSGNHESKYTGFSRDWYLQYTRDVVDYQTDLNPIFTDGNDLDFVVEMSDGSVVVFLHQIYYDYGESTSRLLDDAQLDWLGARFEQYKDRTVFLFFHSQMQGKVGDLNGSDALVMRTDTEDYKRLDAYFKQYTNVIFFNGHSHGSFDPVLSEEYGDRIFNTYGGEYATMAHIPSLAASSLGYIVHVYEDSIVFEGYHFSKEQTIAYATFIIEK